MVPTDEELSLLAGQVVTMLAESGDPKQVVSNLEGDELKKVLSFAATAAAITCSRRGADMPRRNEL